MDGQCSASGNPSGAQLLLFLHISKREVRMLARRPTAVLVILSVAILAAASPSAADSVTIKSGQFAPITEKPYFKMYGIGEGVEWVVGEGTMWVAGVDLPPRALMTSMIVYCLDNVETDAVVRLYKVKGDGTAPTEVEVVVTGGTRASRAPAICPMPGCATSRGSTAIRTTTS